MAAADRFVMEGMSVIPIAFDSSDYMQKPYVKGLPVNPLSEYRFKYAWVETN
jgi:ABC-type oligopeptide transport system substrate-binding subunit